MHCNPQQQPRQIDSVLQMMPKGSRVTHRRLITGDEFRGSEIFKGLTEDRKALIDGCDAIEACTVGKPAEPLEFLDRAIKAGHPRGMEVHVDELVHDVIIKNFHGGAYELASKRINFFKKWQARAKTIDEVGDSFLQSSPPHAKKILQGKRLQLRHEVLCDLGYTDEHLVHDISQGFELTGWLRKSGSFVTGVKRPAFSRATLLKLASGLNRATLRSMERQELGPKH